MNLKLLYAALMYAYTYIKVAQKVGLRRSMEHANTLDVLPTIDNVTNSSIIDLSDNSTFPVSNETLNASISLVSGFELVLKNLKINDVYYGQKFQYYQTDNSILKVQQTKGGLKLVSQVDISVPNIIFDQVSCSHVVVDSRETYSISSCLDKSDSTMYLIMISYLSSKPCYVQSLETNLINVQKIKLMEPLLYVLDESQTTSPFHTFRVNLGDKKNVSEVLEVFNPKTLYPEDNLVKVDEKALVAINSITLALPDTHTSVNSTSEGTNNSSVPLGASPSGGSSTTVQGWIVIFLILIGGLTLVAYLLTRENKFEQKPDTSANRILLNNQENMP